MLELPNGLANGVRTASDFLMALQLTGAARTDSLANMQLRLPVVVVGGGLTAIDTATEALASTPCRWRSSSGGTRCWRRSRAARPLKRHGPTTSARSRTSSSRTRARCAPNVRQAKREGRAARIAELLQGWGGVTIAYRHRLIDSPAYTLNHEEVGKALEEGIRFAEGLTPLAVHTDADGRACALEVSEQHNDGDGVWHEYARVTLPARTILIAAGTQPNTVLAREDAAHFHLDGKFFRLLDEDSRPATPVKGLAKPATPVVLTDIRPDGRATSFFGDLHPSYAGNVVKAMASAKQGAPVVTRMLERVAPASVDDDETFLAVLGRELRATVVRVERLTPTIVEVVVHAPAAARRYRPGQFYRLQNFEALAPAAAGTRLAMEGIALTGAWVDRERGPRVDDRARDGRVVGPLRATQAGRARDPDGAHGYSHRNRKRRDGCARRRRSRQRGAVLDRPGVPPSADRRSSISPATRSARTATRSPTSRPRPTLSSGAATRRRGSSRPARRIARYVGNIVEAMRAYASGELGAQPVPFGHCERLIAIGSDAMMAAVGRARETVLAAHLPRARRALASINSPMQCMMKEICAQCLQPQRDPATGKVTYVFSCFNQDQPLDRVDFPGLAARLAQNSVQEKLTAQWIRHCLDASAIAPSPARVGDTATLAPAPR